MKRLKQINKRGNMDIKEAFLKDGFRLTKSYTINQATGYVAESINSINHLNRKPKKAYYLEGSAYEMGFQMGYLANKEVRSMVKHFPNAIFSGLIDPTASKCVQKFVTGILLMFVKSKLSSVTPDIPQAYIDEANGMVDGIKKARKPWQLKNPDFSDIWAMNIGMDIMMAYFSNPDKFLEELADFIQNLSLCKRYLHGFRKYKPQANQFRFPHFCNAYSAFGEAVSDKDTHFFGRDWMLNGGNVLAKCAALMIVKPTDGRQPIAMAAAPGLIGSALAVNLHGVAMGVDMATGVNADRERPGFNSILLVRDCVHTCDSAASVADKVTKAQRGTPFIYPVSDGKLNEACVIEAGMNIKDLDPLSYPSDEVKKSLPDQAFLDSHAEKPVNGAFVRWNHYKQPSIFIEKFNPGLFELFDKNFNSASWGENGFVFSKPYDDSNAFGYYYFNPQRETHNDLILATNSWLSPHLNICSMGALINALSETFKSDLQWRYDLLNQTLLKNYGKLDWDSAWASINFLSPTIGEGPGKQYYMVQTTPPVLPCPWNLPTVKYRDKDGKKKTTWRVDGMTNLCELRKEKKIRSLYGTYADNPVEITLINYV